MADLIRVSKDEGLGFGDYTLEEKTKLSDFEFKGDIYKVKTFKDFTKLEKNECLLYESEPGTNVEEFKAEDGHISFVVEGEGATQITLGLEDNAKYIVKIDENELGEMETNMGGKLVLSVDLEKGILGKIFIERV